MPFDQASLNPKVFVKNSLLFLFSLAALFLLYLPLRNIFLYSSYQVYYSYTVLIPFVSAYLLYKKRKSILSPAACSIKTGVAVMFAGLTLYGVGFFHFVAINQDNQSSLLIFAALLFWIGSFVLLYGIRNFRKALFPLLFLGFMIPWPPFMIDKAIYLLQTGSTELVDVIFTLMGWTFIREGFVFYMPEIGIEVGPACSGIRSAIALLITSVLAAWLFLDATWRRLLFFFSIFPLVILKNGIRILTLYLLAIHVDKQILIGSPLHTASGVLIFIPTLLLLGLFLWILRKQEQAQRVERINRQPEASSQ